MWNALKGKLYYYYQKKSGKLEPPGAVKKFNPDAPSEKDLTREERACYEKICELVPELKLYKYSTVLHVRERAQLQGCSGLPDYYYYLQENPEERQFLKNNLTLSGTHFFRGEDWPFFIENGLAGFAGRSGLKVWCAGASSGEEAYSVLAALLEFVPLEEIRVLATDYNETLLEKCRTASYGNLHWKEIPERYQKWFERGEKRFTVLPELKEVVEARGLNLLTDEYPAGFDVILCRNVIKFFSLEMIPVVQKKLAASLNPGGVLFLSADGDHRGLELIPKPKKLGLRQLGDRPVYRKES